MKDTIVAFHDANILEGSLVTNNNLCITQKDKVENKINWHVHRWCFNAKVYIIA